MALFAVMLTYIDDKDEIARVRPAHREHLAAQFEAGRLVHAGPFLDDSGGMAVYTADSIEEIHEILAADPFTLGGIVTGTVVKEWKMVFDAAGRTS